MVSSSESVRTERGSPDPLAATRATRGPKLGRLIEAAVGVLFVWAAGVKFWNGAAALQTSIAGFALLPGWAVGPWSYLLPPWEAVTGVCLIFGWLRSGARATAMGLLGLFLVALGVAWARGQVVDCGCFGAGVASRWAMAWAMVRDVAMLAALGVAGRRAGSGEQEARSKERGARSKERGAGSEERGAGSEERGARSGERGAGSEERGAGRGEQGAGSRESGK